MGGIVSKLDEMPADIVDALPLRSAFPLWQRRRFPSRPVIFLLNVLPLLQSESYAKQLIFARAADQRRDGVGFRASSAARDAKAGTSKPGSGAAGQEAGPESGLM